MLVTGKVLETDEIVLLDLEKFRTSKRLGGFACNSSLREARNEGSGVELEAHLGYTVIAPKLKRSKTSRDREVE